MTDQPPDSPESAWRLLLRLRWPVGAAIAIAFAVGQVLEALVLGKTGGQGRLFFDVVGWGLLGGLAAWTSLTWASRQEQRYQADVEHSLHEQQALNRQLQRANSQLALLSEVNRRIAESATLDEILNAALGFPQELVRTHAAALFLNDPTGPIATRVVGVSVEQLTRLRESFGVVPPASAARQPTLYTASETAPADPPACLLVPLHDGQTAVGWIELYLAQAQPVAADELALLETIASEIAEVIVSTRRRSQEERAIYELERAIAEERARIARDIHDGLAQTLAFRRMRIDLWLDWLESDRERLRAELIENKQLLREQIKELRRAIFALRPVQFDELGFVGGLHRYIVEFANQHGWQTHIDLSAAPPSLTPELEAICFRIVQEALTNIAKHARGSEVSVIIDQVDGGLRVQIGDNGVGFDPGQLADGDGSQLGLRQMQERVKAVRGHVTMLSQPGIGTQLRAWIPLISSTRSAT